MAPQRSMLAPSPAPLKSLKGIRDDPVHCSDTVNCSVRSPQQLTQYKQRTISEIHQYAHPHDGPLRQHSMQQPTAHPRAHSRPNRTMIRTMQDASIKTVVRVDTFGEARVPSCRGVAHMAAHRCSSLRLVNTRYRATHNLCAR